MLHEEMKAGRAPSAFRAYASLDDGAKDYARFLSQPRYQSLMRAADQPDANLFRLALVESYSKDYSNVAATNNLRGLQREFGLNESSEGSALNETLELAIIGGLLWWAWRALR
jgi:hypothetical protein